MARQSAAIVWNIRETFSPAPRPPERILIEQRANMVMQFTPQI